MQELTESIRELKVSIRAFRRTSMASMRCDKRVNNAMPAPRMVTMMAMLSVFTRLILSRPEAWRAPPQAGRRGLLPRKGSGSR